MNFEPPRAYLGREDEKQNIQSFTALLGSINPSQTLEDLHSPRSSAYYSHDTYFFGTIAPEASFRDYEKKLFTHSQVANASDLSYFHIRENSNEQSQESSENRENFGNFLQINAASHHQISPQTGDQSSCLGMMEYSVDNSIYNQDHEGSVEKISDDAYSAPSRVKGHWTRDEDRLLKKLVVRHGERKWSHIAKEFQSRTGKQCRERWHNHLRPDIKEKNWTPEEDEILIQAHSELGNKWVQISKLLPGRTENAIKNHWNTNKRKNFSKRNYTPNKTPKPKTALQIYIGNLGHDGQEFVASPRQNDHDVPNPNDDTANTDMDLNFNPSPRGHPNFMTAGVPFHGFASYGSHDYWPEMMASNRYAFHYHMDPPHLTETLGCVGCGSSGAGPSMHGENKEEQDVKGKGKAKMSPF